jgi:enterochelin esterase-like enzyme
MLVALLVSACQPIQAPAPMGGVELKTETFTSPALADNLIGDPAERPISILLPPSYGSGDKRYPVIYVLHGYRENAMDIAEPMQAALEPLMASREAGEMILVFPDCSNRWGGCMYLNSPTLGNYETYITQDLVDYVDAHYRTLPARESRGITGCSMGGVGAIHLALKYPEVFSVSVPVSGVYDREHDPLVELGVAGYTRTLTVPSDFDTLDFLTQAAIASAWCMRS